MEEDGKRDENTFGQEILKAAGAPTLNLPQKILIDIKPHSHSTSLSPRTLKDVSHEATRTAMI